MGLPVFKLPPGRKEPPPKRFYEKASADPTVVEGWWTDEDGVSEDFNIGVATGGRLPDGRQLHVIDIDNKPGKSGWSTLDEFESMGLDTDTMRVTTPSGGIHLYYGCPADWPQLSNNGPTRRLGIGVDNRGYHGYVVGPGSTTSNGAYVISVDLPIATLPDWMLEHLNPKRELDTALKGTWLVEPDLPENVDQALRYAAAAAAPEEGTRNQGMHGFALDMHDFGISPDLAIEIGVEHWALMQDLSLVEEFEKTVRSTYASADLPAGRRAVSLQFDMLVDEVGAAAVTPARDVEKAKVEKLKAKYRLESMDEIEQTPKPTWLVQDWIQEGKVGLIYGKWGTRKSFIVLDIAMHLAYGKTEWHSYALPDTQREVLVIASEGASGFKGRMRAWRRHYGVTHMSPHLSFMRQSVNFMVDREFDALEQVIAESGKRFSLIIVDTVGRTLAGKDSNTQEVISQFMERCRRLGEISGASVIGVHHENKGGTMLGSIVFENDSDFMFHVTKDESSLGLETQVYCAKQKEAPDGWTRNITFLQSFDMLDDDAEGSLVVDNVGTENVVPTGKVATPKTRAGRPGKAIPLDDMRAYLTKMQEDFDAGKPWNDAHASKAIGRHITRRTMTLLSLGTLNRAQDLVDGWIDMGIIGKVLRDKHTKQSGYRPLFDVDRCLEIID